MDFDHDLVRIVDDWEGGVFGESQLTVTAIFINHPGLHHSAPPCRGAECPEETSLTNQGRTPTQLREAEPPAAHYLFKNMHSCLAESLDVS